MEAGASQVQVAIAAVGLLIVWSSTIVGAGVWIVNRVDNKVDSAKRDIMTDFNSKHESNAVTVQALNELVIRHDVLLNQEFGAPLANGRSKHLRG